MKKHFKEQSVIFLSIVKWAFLSACIGVIVGLSTTVFLKSLSWGISFAGRWSYYFLSLPLAFLASTALIRYLAPDAAGHGTEKVIEAVHKRFGKINALVVPVKLVSTVITLAAGGSAGKEGPCAQIGAGLASSFADVFRFDNRDRRKLVICGISAGFATVFGTPIAGAIFGTEVLFVGSILYDVLMPSFIAGIIGFQISSAMGVTYPHHDMNFQPVFSEVFFLKVIAAGIFFGLCSFLLIEILKFGEFVSDKIQSWWKRCLIGGALLVALTFIFSRDFLGLGIETIQSTLNGRPPVWYSFVMKSIFTSITLGFGGSGGILTPIFFVGSTSGALFAKILHLDIATFAAIGFVSLLAGAANTPIAASIMAVELFGPKIAPYAALSCVISFLMTGHRSVYPSQVLSITKSSSLIIAKDQQIRDVEGVELDAHSERISGEIDKGIRSFKKYKNRLILPVGLVSDERQTGITGSTITTGVRSLLTIIGGKLK